MLEEYKELSYADVERIGWVNLESTMLEGKKYWPSIWSEKLVDDNVLLVVQLTKWYFLRIMGATDCIGFLKFMGSRLSLLFISFY